MTAPRIAVLLLRVLVLIALLLMAMARIVAVRVVLKPLIHMSSVVMPERHALSRRHGGEALQRHGKRHGENEEEAQEAHGHDCI